MASQNRPLSPHLQIYRPQISSVLSILHRITGVGLAVGSLLLVYWIIAAAVGPEAFATAQVLIGSFFGRLLLFGWSFALFFHLVNGIRHLFWDIGWGFELKTVSMTGWAALIAALLLTLIAWALGYSQMGLL
jgi:succinate dehydrogenase / fumarate reductase, cytochrome b subunit